MFLFQFCNNGQEAIRITKTFNAKCRSQWPRSLRHELFSLARTLGSWVRIPPKAWMSVLCPFILCLVVLCVGRGLSDGLVPHPRSRTDCVWDPESEKVVKAQHRAVESHNNNYKCKVDVILFYLSSWRSA
jgi:hypothetical protein